MNDNSYAEISSTWTIEELYEELADYEERLVVRGLPSAVVSERVDTAQDFLRRLDAIRLT